MHHTRAYAGRLETLENGPKRVRGARFQAVFGVGRERRQEVAGDHTEWPEVKTAEIRRDRFSRASTWNVERDTRTQNVEGTLERGGDTRTQLTSWSAGAPASAQRPPVSPSSGRRAVGVWRVAMMEEDAVAGWVADSDAVAAAGVPHLAELEAGGFELRLRRRDIGDAQRDRCGRQGRELVVVRMRRHDRERDVADLVLDPVLSGRVRIPLEAQHLAVEVIGRVHVRHREADVVNALDVNHGAHTSSAASACHRDRRRLPTTGSRYALTNVESGQHS